MARQNHGPLSRAKGKLGGVVYQQYEGMQISREYQPVVKNPQSEKQTTNRAKFKLSSQIVAEFKDVLSARLSKLSIYERTRRASAVSSIFAVIETENPSSPSALVSSVVGAINEKSVSSMPAPTLAVVTNDIKITATSGETVLYVQVAYDFQGKMLSRVVQSYESDGTAKNVVKPAGAMNHVVMAVSMISNTEDGRATISNLSHFTGGELTNMIARATSAGDLEVSNLAGAYAPVA